MTPIEARFSERHFAFTDKVKMLQWGGNHWDDILYFPKDYQVGYITEGEGTFTQGTQVLPITAGQFYLVHPGNLHSGKPNSAIGWAAEVLVLKSDYVHEICRELNRGAAEYPVYEPMVADQALSKIMLPHFQDTLQMLTDHTQTEQTTEINLFYAINELLSLPASQKISNEETKSQQMAVESAKTFIEDHFKENFSLDELAKHACLSKFHLLRAFKKELGITPSAFQMQLRLNAARKLIFQNISLTEVALALGFSDQAHFTNTFKKYSNGVSPKDLKKTAIFYNFKE